MSTFHEVSPSLWVKTSKLYHYNSAVVGCDDTVLLIDPGVYPDELNEIARFVESFMPRRLVVFVTHGDWDHVLGPERFPSAEVITHASYEREMVRKGESTLRQLSQWERNAGIERTVPFVLPLPGRTVEHNETIDLQPFTFRALHTPGHAPEQIALYETQREVLWAADMLSDVEIPYVCSSVTAYIETLQSLQSLPIGILIPGHGNCVSDSRRIQSILDSDLRYLEQLHHVVKACVDAGASIDETLTKCASISLHRDHATDAHRMNVETVFKELGGEVGGQAVGWAGYVETAGG